MKVKIVVFLKAPRPGFVKTRLAASLGNEEACRVYKKLAHCFLDQLSSFLNVELRFSPDDASSEIAQFLKSSEWSFKPQGEGNLGERMCRAMTEVLEGSDSVLIFGTDCPYIDHRDVDEAIAALRGRDVVLGPAMDGGYWAIGLKKVTPEIFRGVNWSSDQVLKQTLNRIQDNGLTCHLLRKLEDIDDVDSWERYRLQSTDTE